MERRLNNWLSAFTGRSAWQWAPERRQFYFYNFFALGSQI